LLEELLCLRHGHQRVSTEQAFLWSNQANDVIRIYAEIGPGERIALSKLAVEHYEKHGQPLRVAIDISIWQFQIQAGQGTSNMRDNEAKLRLSRWY
jgi:hypothetical protein